MTLHSNNLLLKNEPNVTISRLTLYFNQQSVTHEQSTHYRFMYTHILICISIFLLIIASKQPNFNSIYQFKNQPISLLKSHLTFVEAIQNSCTLSTEVFNKWTSFILIERNL